MGITDAFGNFIGSLLSGAIRKAGDLAGSFVAKKIRAPEKWELIKVDDEEKKVSFSRIGDGGYNLLYDSKDIGQISRHETKVYKGKSENSTKYAIIYKLEVMHQNFKNRELATRIAMKIYKDYLEYAILLDKQYDEAVGKKSK
ncbi:MAG: hypothetical protein ABH842_01830 [Candidatus Micrarchaeota archaeon]